MTIVSGPLNHDPRSAKMSTLFDQDDFVSATIKEVLERVERDDSVDQLPGPARPGPAGA